MRIAFLGDICLRDTDAVPRVGNTLRDVITSCDRIVANLEGPLTSSRNPVPKTGPTIRQRRAVISLLHLLGADTIGLANNHVMDYGVEGLNQTLAVLDQEGLTHGGANLSIDKVYRPVRLRTPELTVSILFAAENGFGCLSRPQDSAGYAWLFHPRFRDLLREEAHSVDHTVVFVHGGVEKIDRPLPEFRDAYHRLVDLGASAVVGHHPHVTQAFEVYRGAPIFYSIGNLYFPKRTSDQRWFCSLVPVIEFQAARAIRFTVHHVRVSEEDWIEVDTTPSTRARTEALCAEFTNGDYAESLRLDLLWLWKHRYLPHYESALNGLASPSSIVRYLKRAFRALFGHARIPDLLVLQSLCEIESHRWAVAGAVRQICQNRRKSRGA